MSLALPVSTVPSTARQPASPRFIVGRDPHGFWVAVAVDGLGGGLFRTCHDAIHYATDVTNHRPDAVVVTTGQVELRL